MNEVYGFAAVIFSIAVAQVFSNRQMNGRLDKVETSIKEVRTELVARIDRVQADLTARIDKVQADLTARIDKVQADLTARIDRVQSDLNTFNRELGRHDSRLDGLERKAS
jgi:peptidoglycan hydrolase CwlO-like protein